MKNQDAKISSYNSEAELKDKSSGAAPLNHASFIHDPAYRRMLWRCRRGLLELDIVLGYFVEARYAELSGVEKQVFEVLLDMPDNQLWDMISGKLDVLPDEQQALLNKIRAV